MALPSGITTRRVTFGPAAVMESGQSLGLKVTVRASRPLVWGLTGVPIRNLGKTTRSGAGLACHIDLPVTDQTGWTSNGEPVSTLHGRQTHTYTADVTYTLFGNEISLATIGPFALPTDDLSDVDADQLTYAPTYDQPLVQIPNQWGESVVEAQAAAISAASSAASAANALSQWSADSDADVADQLDHGPLSGAVVARNSPYSFSATNPPPGAPPGIVADGATDDAPALNALIAWAGVNNYGRILLPAKFIRCNSTVTIKTGVSLEGYNNGWPENGNVIQQARTVLDFPLLSSGSAVVIGDQTHLYTNATAMRSIALRGPLVTPPYDASVGLNYTVGNTNGLSVTGWNVRFEDVQVQNFDTNIFLRNDNTWAITFDSCNLGNASKIIDVNNTAAGTTNAGERILFLNTVFYNSISLGWVQNTNISIFFIGCAFDYMGHYGSFYDAYAWFANCHIETTYRGWQHSFAAGSGAIHQYLYDVSNARMHWTGCEFLLYDPRDPNTDDGTYGVRWIINPQASNSFPFNTPNGRYEFSNCDGYGYRPVSRGVDYQRSSEPVFALDSTGSLARDQFYQNQFEGHDGKDVQRGRLIGTMTVIGQTVVDNLLYEGESTIARINFYGPAYVSDYVLLLSRHSQNNSWAITTLQTIDQYDPNSVGNPTFSGLDKSFKIQPGAGWAAAGTFHYTISISRFGPTVS